MNYNKLTKKQLISLVKELRTSYGDLKISTSKKAYDEIIKLVENWQQETMFVIYLNGANKIIDSKAIFVGTVNKTIAHPREIFTLAISKRAVSIIIAHNHPSGDVLPSPEDIMITKRLMDAGKILGINVLDHIIFSAREFNSLQETEKHLFI